MGEKEMGSRESRLKNRWAVRDEHKLYYALQLVFAIAQIATAYIVVWQENFQLSGVVIFALFGAVLLLLVLSGWQSRAVRIFGRVLAALVLAFFMAFIVSDTLTTSITEPLGNVAASRSVWDYIGQLATYMCLYIQALLLMIFPACILAVKRVECRFDLHVLRVISWAVCILSCVTFALSFEDVTRMDFSATLLNFVPNTVLLIAYCVFGVASVIAVMMAHPYGVNWLKKKVNALKEKKK